MSTKSPHLLRNLAVQSLLRDKALAVVALEDLPGKLFPAVFKEAFTRGHGEVLKAMVLSWPFPCLPLRALMTMRKAETLDSLEDNGQMLERMFHAVLDGLDVLLSQKVHSRRLKLKVLDMPVERQNFWRVWAGNIFKVCSNEAMKRRKTEGPGSRGGKKKRFKVMIHLHLSQGHLCPEESYLLRWVHAREDLVQLECKNLCITTMCFPTRKEFLAVLTLDSVQEMQNLHKRILSEVSVPAMVSREKREELFAQIISHLMNLHCLQEIYVDSVDLLEGYLGRLLRCLPSPLETFSITHCQLLHSDWIQLPQAEQTRQLKVLQMRCIQLTDFSPESFQILLKNVASTLTTLHLENCGITEAQVCAFLPSLSCCSQLTTFCFARNFMSIDTMKKLLGHTTRLSNLTLELYSSPSEVWVSRHGINQQL
ncbi:PREDICTED: PRAME family member 12-like [Chinchilla lanigera]|uniref:PRAME family member 12-like n=1 Tax=Chinchilla lanigera TaxID=34839 RepID=UPI00038ED2A7|nr:PREDICTED: PRAME family member 12-like [Chinchilla lanigera]